MTTNKMKLYSIFGILVLLFSCNKHERNCKDFKTGKFEFTQEVNGKKSTSVFTRTKNLQIETYNGQKDTASVHWVNDCEFILRKLHPKTITEHKAINIKILFTENNKYTFEYSFVGDVKKQRGIAVKID